MRRVLLINAVGLTPRLINEQAPNLLRLARTGALAPMSAVLPAVTCSAQATMLTGLLPKDHGAVGNGWYFRELGEVFLWRQSNALIAGEKLYEVGRRRLREFTCAKIFWWWNMGAAVDWSLTPRPFYPADGRKIPAVYGQPESYASALQAELGPFPFFDFWGPRSGLASSRWLAAAARHTLLAQGPALTMVYLPHLDYSHQRYGPDDPRSVEAVRELDELIGGLANAAQEAQAELIVVSEYGLERAERCVHINRDLRRAGLLAVRPTPAGEILDPFASAAFAVSDHQIAHVYAADERARAAAAEVIRGLPGVGELLDDEGKRAHGIDHARSGDLVAVAQRGAWFTYYYWLEESAAPDFARTVDIHRKPGYDPCELFIDPRIRFPGLRVGLRLAQKALGMRYLMDVIPTDAELVRGSHGRLPDDPRDGPVFLCSQPFGACGPEPADGAVAMTSLPERVLALCSAP